jgi:EF-hand domain pair
LEFREAVLGSFSSTKDAFEFFVKNGDTETTGAPEISRESYIKTAKMLLCKATTEDELLMLWTQIAGKRSQPSISKDHFYRYFSGLPFSGKVRIRPGTTGSIRRPDMRATIGKRALLQSSSNGFGNALTVEPDLSDTVSKVRQVLQASNKTLEEVFKEFDLDGNGVLSNMEFRQGIRKLNLGLTLMEIDDLLNYCDSNNDGLIDWQEFSNKFKPE